MKVSTKQAVFATLAGLLFALGLVVSGMTDAGKVLGFLNIAGLTNGVSWVAEPGLWDPSLALVMGGALSVTVKAFTLTPKAGKPWADTAFHLPERRTIDRPLMVGALMFGGGWGLVGLCPGPALANLLLGGLPVAVFVGAMLAGMVIARKWQALA